LLLAETMRSAASTASISRPWFCILVDDADISLAPAEAKSPRQMKAVARLLLLMVYVISTTLARE